MISAFKEGATKLTLKYFGNAELVGKINAVVFRGEGLSLGSEGLVAEEDEAAPIEIKFP